MTVSPGSGIRRQDGSRVIGSVSANTVGRYLGFDFIRHRWADISEL